MHFWARVLLLFAGVATVMVCSMTATGLLLARGPSVAQGVMLAMLLVAAATLTHALRQPTTVAAVLLLSVAPFVVWLAYAQWLDGFRSDLAGLGAALAVAVPAGVAGGAWLDDRYRYWRPLHSVAVLFTLAAVLLILIAPMLLVFGN